VALFRLALPSVMRAAHLLPTLSGQGQKCTAMPRGPLVRRKLAAISRVIGERACLTWSPGHQGRGLAGTRCFVAMQ
jgi:hypothetical protein